ncbi:hypothetical protein [Rhizobium sp. LC145]|uniref:hypothetical protein n=1 Tax=Rhizobium sp. LC145 TaxID=1120688 RepID=UPI00062A0CD5|nr:hypothetical protein [Rhizobium sp. LC145]KKX29187.1 hypothetical protein YH62_15400 [Rhizobium sp. LC145]TKT42794.1 hypothetical protein FDR95_28070 [Rhizobiaceae bacterium LC148]
MHTIRNRSNGPFDLISTGGPLRLPASGEVSGEFGAEYLMLLKASPVVEVIEGASLVSEIERLRAEYADLTGKKPHHLWKVERLQSEIDKALEA